MDSWLLTSRQNGTDSTRSKPPSKSSTVSTALKSGSNKKKLQSSAISGPSKKHAPSVSQSVNCPLCNLPIVNDENIINMHIDTCLKKTKPKEFSKDTSSSGDDDMKILNSFGYNAINNQGQEKYSSESQKDERERHERHECEQVIDEINDDEGKASICSSTIANTHDALAHIGGDECAICLVAIDPRGGVPLSTPGCCGAQFHSSCIADVIRAGRNLSCPLCRTALPAALLPTSSSTSSSSMTKLSSSSSSINGARHKIMGNGNFNVSNSNSKSSSVSNNSAKLSQFPSNLFASMSKSVDAKSNCSVNSEQRQFSHRIETVAAVPGLWIIHDFITEEEETELVQQIDSDSLTPWEHSSFNGHCYSKKFGVRTQFGLPKQDRLVRKNDVSKGEYDLPIYLEKFVQRWRRIVEERKASDNISSHVELLKFSPNECNVNGYYKSQNNYLRPHFDDRNLSGPLLINLSLLGRSRMTYVLPPESPSLNKEPIPVFLPRRCLQLVTSQARWSYMHSINASDILDERRVSITWRFCGEKSKGNHIYSASSGQQRDLKFEIVN